LRTELEIGLLFPCDVIVCEEGRGTAVSIPDPISMLEPMQNTELVQVAREARTRRELVVEALGE
jgi:uncharacterized protein (DUF302 family)